MNTQSQSRLPAARSDAWSAAVGHDAVVPSTDGPGEGFGPGEGEPGGDYTVRAGGGRRLVSA
jgi:hypothetical protein